MTWDCYFPEFDESKYAGAWQLHMLGLIVEVIHLKLETINKCLNILERMEIVDRNKDGSLSLSAVPLITSVSEKRLVKKIKLLWNVFIQNLFTFDVWSYISVI